MEIVKLKVGEVTLRPLLWKEVKDCHALAEVHSGLMKNSVYYEEAEYRMACELQYTDANYLEEIKNSKNKIDKLSQADGMKLRAVVKKMLKTDEEQAKN